jgi:Ribonuclease toxin, BrnT, of type II toxin-antitoxin system
MLVPTFSPQSHHNLTFSLDMYISNMHNQPMKVTWDPAKVASNFRKHKIRFSDAESLLFDPMALTVEDEGVEGE